jgi:signal transduction histidine kinase
MTQGHRPPGREDRTRGEQQTHRVATPGRMRHTFGTIGSHLVALVVIQLIFVSGLVGFAARQDFENARSDAETRTAIVARQAADFVAEEMESNLTSLADMPGVLSAIPVAKLCEVNDTAPEDDDLRWFHASVHIRLPDGSPACASAKGQPNVGTEHWFRSALAAPDPVFEGPLVDPTTKKDVIMYAISIPGKLVVAYGVELDSMGPALDNQFGSGPSPVRFTVVDPSRRTEMGSSGGRTGRALTGSGFAGALRRSRNTFEDLDGTERIYSEATVRDWNWHVYAGISTADAFGHANDALRERVIFGVVMLALVLAAALVVQRRFARPIRSLLAATKRVKEGDSQTPVAGRGPVELIELAESFNEMASVRAQAEEALLKAFVKEQHASEELREVDAMRKAFLMAISHELRTPLTSVVGYADFLDTALDEMSPQEIRQSISAISTQSKRLQRIMLDLLDIERLSRGTIEPSVDEVDIGRLLADVVERTSAAARVKVTVSGPTKSWVDPALTERMVENLVINAIKHTPPDTRIWVKAKRANDRLRITVEDAGGGIPDDFKASIFEPFKQGEDVQEHSPGTGVGLSLVAQFAKLQEGRAWVEDRRGGGASFRIELPANDPAMRAASRRRRSLAERAA